MSGGVLLINMPFAGVDRPPIGIGNLQSAVRRRGIPCDIRNFNIEFADWVGAPYYEWVSEYMSHTLFIGEWVFADHMFRGQIPDGNAYIRYLRDERFVEPEVLHSVVWLRRFVEPFLDYCLASTAWDRYSIVGFTSTFEQNLPSLALACAVKQWYPAKTTVMGGANCEDRMGLGLHRCFPFLDYVFSGESDQSFPEFVDRIVHRRPVDDIPGLIHRNGNGSAFGAPPRAVEDLDALSFPEFNDYFLQLEHSSIPWEIPLKLQMETSRGCWWGAKHHCTFCGLNRETMHYRAKSKDRVLAELDHLVSRYPLHEIATVDNIIDMQYFRDLLPELKRRKLDLTFFYEVKANLTKEQVRLLADAGITWIQPGIESLHQDILNLMRKGVSPLQNVQLLKWCRQFGVRPTWNFLYGFPGESARNYEEMMPLLECLAHLPPPEGTGRIRLDRFSPYFQDPASLGMVKVRPMEIYKYLYPLPEPDLSDIAYFFDYDYADTVDPSAYIGPIENRVAAWREAHAGGASLVSDAVSEDLLMIRDMRPDPVQRSTQLQGWEKRVYEFCDQTRPVVAIERMLRNGHEDPAFVSIETLNSAGCEPNGPGGAELSTWLDRMVQLRIMARDGGQYLSLAIPRDCASKI